MGIKRLKYISSFTGGMTQAELDALIVKAARRNMKLGVTGFLMASGGVFFQVIEGPAEAIDTLWAMIRRDRRHTDVLLLGVEEDAGERLFPSWSMRKVDLEQDAGLRTLPIRTLLEGIAKQRELLDGMSRAVERLVWNELVGR